MACWRFMDCCSRLSDISDICKAAEALFWTDLSRCCIEWLICEAPVFCSSVVAEILTTRSLVISISGSKFASIALVASANSLLSLAALRISEEDCLLISANLLTSDATTANPLPCSPARAASTEAFNASKSIFFVISSTIVIRSEMSFIESVVRCTASKHFLDSSATSSALASVSFALCELPLIASAISAIAVEVSSTELAWVLPPSETKLDVDRNSTLPVATFVDTSEIVLIILDSCWVIKLKELDKWPNSSLDSWLTFVAKLPKLKSFTETINTFNGLRIRRHRTSNTRMRTIISIILLKTICENPPISCSQIISSEV